MKSKPPTKKSRIEINQTNSPSTSKASTSGKASAAAEPASKMKPPVAAMTAALTTTFPNIELPDLNNYTRVSNLLKSSDPIPINVEDLDATQTELETILSNVSVRVRIIERCKRVLKAMPASTTLTKSTLGEHYDPSHQEKINAVKNIMDSGHGTRTSVNMAAKLVMVNLPVKTHGKVPAVSPILGSNRKSNNSASAAIGIKLQPKKKLKTDSGKTEKPGRAAQNRSHSISTEDSTRQEIPNQFWEFTDSYCRNITSDDLDKLEKLIETHKPLPEGTFDIPPLGKHFRDSSANDNGRLKNRERRETQKDMCGPLTQRLVAALVDERVNSYNHGHTNGAREDNEGYFINRPGLIKALGFDSNGTHPPLEARLRQVLLEQGLLQADDEEMASPDDEILAEIKRTQMTLNKLHTYNSEKLQDLLESAKKEHAIVGVKTDLEKADKEVVEAYRLIISCRQKKKPLTKKEKDTAFKALQSRKTILDKLTVKEKEIADMES